MTFAMPKAHRAKLRESGLTPEYAEYAGIKSVGDTQRIEYRDVHGKPTGFWRARNHAPDAPSKYTQPKGTTVHLYIPPFPRASKLRWARIAKDTSVQVAITEGEFKTLCAVSRDIPCIGIAGVDCYQSGGKPLADWAEFEWEQRSVLLIPDSDYASKPQVREPTVKLADYLASLGARVEICELPTLAGHTKTGLDDYLVKKTVAEFHEHVPRHALDSEHVAKVWRGSSDASLPKLALEPIASDWLTTELPPIEYTWANWLVRGTVGLLVAEGGTGKTFLNLQLAAAVATGSKFLGWPTHQGTALYLGVEDSEPMLRRRIYSSYAARTQTMSPTERKAYRAALRANLILQSWVGQQFHLITAERRRWRHSANIEPLIEMLRPLELSLLVLDPLARIFGGESENDNIQATMAVNALEHIAQELGCTILTTHHTGKDKNSNGSGQYASRGSSGFEDASRAVLRLRTLADPEYLRLKNVPDDIRSARSLRLLSAVKNSYGPRAAPIYLYQTGGGTFEKYEAEFSVPEGYSGFLARLRRHIKKHGEALTKSAVTQSLRGEIFDGSLSRKQAETFWQEAINDNTLYRTGSSKGADTFKVRDHE